MNNMIFQPFKMSIATLKLALVYVLVFPSTAYAYIDPGTGGLIITTILGSIAAIGYTLRSFFGKIKSRFFENDKPSDTDDK